MASDSLNTKRLDAPRQDLSDAYSLPANFLEIEVCNPETHGVGWRQKYTDYEVKMKVMDRMCSTDFLKLQYM